MDVEGLDKREQLRQERRRQILKAALTVFSEKGYHAANVSDVAARAGVSQGTIYWYFESKGELVTAAVHSFFSELRESVLAATEQGDSASAQLRALGRVMIDFADAAKGFFTLFLEFWASSSEREEAGQLWAELLLEFRDVLVAIIEAGIQRGEFRSVDAEQLVWGVLAAYDGLAAYAVLKPDLDLASIGYTFMDTILEGLRPQKA